MLRVERFDPFACDARYSSQFWCTWRSGNCQSHPSDKPRPKPEARFLSWGTLNPKSQTLTQIAQSKTLSPESSTLHPESSTLNPKLGGSGIETLTILRINLLCLRPKASTSKAASPALSRRHRSPTSSGVGWRLFIGN